MSRIIEEEEGVQVFSTQSSYPFLLMAGEVSTGVSIIPSHLDSIGNHVAGEVFPGGTLVEVLQEEAVR
jgi:hypothetical protein